MHTGNVSNQQQQLRSNYQQPPSNGVEQLPAIENFGTSVNIVTNQSSSSALNSTATMTTTSNLSNSEGEASGNEQHQQESNENLCEIIKKSIVETVTA
jgi:hypothetical protein